MGPKNQKMSKKRPKEERIGYPIRRFAIFARFLVASRTLSPDFPQEACDDNLLFAHSGQTRWLNAEVHQRHVIGYPNDRSPQPKTRLLIVLKLKTESLDVGLRGNDSGHQFQPRRIGQAWRQIRLLPKHVRAAAMVFGPFS